MTTTPKPATSAKKAQDAAAPRPIPEFEGVHDVWPRGDRLRAVRSAAATYRERFVQQGRIHAVRSFDIAAAPYPTRFGFHGAALAVNPFVSIVNRMLVVQFDGFDGELKTLVWEPTVAAGTAQAPFYAQLKRLAGTFSPSTSSPASTRTRTPSCPPAVCDRRTWTSSASTTCTSRTCA